MPHTRSPLRLDEKRSALLVVDLQEKLAPVIPNACDIESEIVRISDAAEIMRIPIGIIRIPL